MVTETDGIILRQTKLPGDRRMLVILTRKYGKISAGTSIKLNGKNKSSLALRVFTHGRYELFHGRDSFSINSAETLSSYFKIGEDVDKYMYASYAMEFTEKVMQEEQPAEKALDLLLEFLKLLQDRKKSPETLVIVYQWKLISLCGLMPVLEGCCRCGKEDISGGLSVVDGGTICNECKNSGQVNQRLLYQSKFDIIRTLQFIRNTDMNAFSKLALNGETSSYLMKILKDYVSYHMDIKNLKSESYLKF